MDLPKTNPDQSVSIYREAARWITSNPESADAQNLAKLILSLSTTEWSYATALKYTEQMSEMWLARALQVIEHYLSTGNCPELRLVGRDLQSMFPTLLHKDANVGT